MTALKKATTKKATAKKSAAKSATDTQRAAHDRDYANFKKSVNMTAAQIEKWLKTTESKSVGQVKPGAAESIGRQSAKKIIKILGKKKAELTAEDYAWMRHVYSYVARHSAQEPRNVETSRWRYSLMNWGHDPMKKRLHG